VSTGISLRWEERRRQAMADLTGVEAQVAAGELDAATADQLRAAYRLELAEADDALAAPLPAPATESRGRRTGRTLIWIGVAIAALAVVVVVASQALVPRNGGTLTGDNTGGVDLSTVTNEQMEAVIASNQDSPQINGMRMALADRYFQDRAYQDAFRHYEAVLEHDPTSVEAARALGRMGWMTFESGEPELARDSIERALQLDPAYGEGRYFLGLVLLCGLGQHQQAAAVLEEVRALPELPAELRPDVDQALDLARTGASCGSG
jgi:tetratricopeptide (TPR) repeat protein